MNKTIVASLDSPYVWPRPGEHSHKHLHPPHLRRRPRRPAPAAAASITVDDVKNVAPPNADARAKGDPDGSLTGTVGDVTVSDAKAGLTIADVVNQVGQNKIAINFVWTLVTGFLVMFMQAGFAIVETGLCRAKNANHTMMMNFMVYGVGMLAYWLIGFAIQMGGVGAVANSGARPSLNAEYTITLFGKPFGLLGSNGIFLMHHGTYDVARHGAVPVPDGVHGHGADHRHRLGGRALEVRGVPRLFVHAGRVHLSAVRQLGLGRRLARHARRNFGLGHGYATSPARAWCMRSAASRRWRWASSSGRASASTRATAKPNAIPGARYRHRADRLLHPGVRLVRLQPRVHARRVGQRRRCASGPSRSIPCWRA